MIKIDETTLMQALRAVTLFRSDDEERPHLHGLFIRVHGKQVEFVATSGFMLGTWTADCEAEGDQNEALLVDSTDAAAVAKDIARIKVDDRAKATLSLAGEEVVLSTGKRMHLRVVPGCTFPPYEEVIPKHRARTTASAIGFTPKFVGLIARAFGQNIVTWEPSGSEVDPVLLTSATIPLRVVLMPARVYGPTLPLGATTEANGAKPAEARA